MTAQRSGKPPVLLVRLTQTALVGFDGNRVGFDGNVNYHYKNRLGPIQAARQPF